jgi:hypothetical protein
MMHTSGGIRFSRVRGLIGRPSSVFGRALLLYLLITVLSVGIAGIVAVSTSSRHILNQAGVASGYALASRCATIEERLLKVEAILFETIYNASSFRLLWAADYGSTGMLIMRDLLGTFRSTVLAHDWLDSVYFFTSRTDYVLSDSKYPLDEFHDQQAIEAARHSDRTEFGPRYVKGELTYSIARTFGFFGWSVSGSVVANLNYRRFFLDLVDYPEGSGFLVIDSTSHVLHPESGAPDLLDLHGPHAAQAGPI